MSLDYFLSSGEFVILLEDCHLYPVFTETAPIQYQIPSRQSGDSVLTNRKKQKSKTSLATAGFSQSDNMWSSDFIMDPNTLARNPLGSSSRHSAAELGIVSLALRSARVSMLSENHRKCNASDGSLSNKQLGICEDRLNRTT